MDSNRLKLKELDYPNNSQGTSSIAYALFSDRRCVFSGITEGVDCTSTINAAERIIALIATREKLNPFDCRFFDLQGCKQYGGGSSCPHPGEFMFDELILDSSATISVKGWRREICPAEVIAAFRIHIGDLSQPAYQLPSSSLHDPNRLNPDNVSDQRKIVHPDVLPLFEAIEQTARDLRDKPDDQELNRTFDADWAQLREMIASGRLVHPQTIVSLELTMMGRKRWEDVEFLNRRMLKLIPDSIESLRSLANTMVVRGRLREAEEVYTVAVETFERIFGRSNISLGQLLSSSLEEATVLADGGSVTMVDAGDVFRYLAQVQLTQQKLPEALVSAAHAFRLLTLGGQPKPAPLYQMAEIFVRQGKLAEAQAKLTECHNLYQKVQQNDFLNLRHVLLLSRALAAGDPDPVKLLDRLNAEAEV